MSRDPGTGARNGSSGGVTVGFDAGERGRSSIQIFDTTLRDGEQSPRTSFSTAQKLDIAATLEAAGVAVIEAGFPANSDSEFEAVRAVAERVDTDVAGLARVTDDDVTAALDAGVDIVHVFVSTSDIQIEDSMHSTRETVLDRAVETVERVAETDRTCLFSPMDATRTDPAFLTRVVEAVSAAGTDWITVPDTCGVATPARFAATVRRVAAATDARIDVHTHDDFGLATANTLAGLEAGADRVQVTVNGVGERAGNAAFEEVVMAAESLYDLDTGIETSRLHDLSETVESASESPVPPSKAVVGDNAFAHESGIHAAGVADNPDTFEPDVMDPESVGASRELVLGKHTGRHSVRERLRDLGFDPSAETVAAITERVREAGREQTHVTAADLRRFAREADLGTAPEVTDS